MNEDKKKVCAYVRVSTNSADQANSYKNQYEYFSDVIKDAGHIFCGIYADKGLTGTKLTRPEFERMITDAGIDILKLYSNNSDKRQSKLHTVYEVSEREPLFNEIWIKNSSRFARNTLSYEIIEKLKSKNVNIFFTDYSINTNDESATLALKMLQVIDEQDSRDKSKKVLFGIERGVENNIVRTTPSIYGYKYYPVPENKLEIIPQEAEVIKTIYNLYADGLGYRRIINYLTENKIYTRKGMPFVQNTIKGILSNQKYYGGNSILKYDSGFVFSKRSYAKVKENYEVRKNDRIPAIITEELFNICKDQKIKSTNQYSQKGCYHGITKFANMLICGNCHEYYVSNVDKGRQFYNCRTKKMQGKKVCDNQNISVTKLESLITAKEYNKKVNYLKSELTIAFENCIADIEIERDRNFENETSELRTEKQILNNNIKNLLKQSAIATSDDVRDIINEELTNISNRIKLIDIEIEKLSNWDNHIDNQIQEIKNTIQELNDIVIKEEYPEDELFNQIHKIVVNDANNIIIHYNIEDKISELLKKYDIQNNKHLMFYKDYFKEIFDI